MNLSSRYSLAIAFSIAMLLSSAAQAQLNNNWIGTGTETWNDVTNWSANALPDVGFDEYANMNGGASVFVDTAITPNPGEARLGQVSGANNTLEIRSGGNLRIELSGVGVTNGGLHMGGFPGAGVHSTLLVSPGGTLTVDGVMETSADNGNVVTIGGLAGVAATVNAGAATLLGQSTFFTNGDLNVTGDLLLGPTGSYKWVINSGANSTVTSGATAQLAGPLVLDFNGFTPAIGQTWNLIDAVDVSGAFSSVSTPDTLGAGQKLTLQTVPNGGGERLQAKVSQVLVLNVNRDTGAVSLGNPNTPGIAIDGYSVKSASGKLSVGAWSSLDDQNALGGDWRESNVSANQLAELKPTTTGTVGANGSQAIGNAYDALGGTFGTSEDLTFDYTLADGTVVDGIVSYTGTKVNTLLLQVDPSNGQARLRNTSNTSVNIDGYDVLSSSGALSTSGWSSLDDQNAAGGDWRESNVSANQLSELKPASSTTLGPGASFNLGALFNVAGAKDLDFNFLIAGNSASTNGAVIYQALSNPVPGDYNNNGVVDAADYTIFRDHLGQAFQLQNEVAGTTPGQVTNEDYTAWRTRFGNTSGSGGGALGAVGVPEPGSLALVAVMLLGLAVGRGKSSGLR